MKNICFYVPRLWKRHSFVLRWVSLLEGEGVWGRRGQLAHFQRAAPFPWSPWDPPAVTCPGQAAQKGAAPCCSLCFRQPLLKQKSLLGGSSCLERVSPRKGMQRPTKTHGFFVGSQSTDPIMIFSFVWTFPGRIKHPGGAGRNSGWNFFSVFQNTVFPAYIVASVFPDAKPNLAGNTHTVQSRKQTKPQARTG